MFGYMGKRGDTALEEAETRGRTPPRPAPPGRFEPVHAAPGPRFREEIFGQDVAQAMQEMAPPPRGFEPFEGPSPLEKIEKMKLKTPRADRPLPLVDPRSLPSVLRPAVPKGRDIRGPGGAMAVEAPDVGYSKFAADILTAVSGAAPGEPTVAPEVSPVPGADEIDEMEEREKEAQGRGVPGVPTRRRRRVRAGRGVAPGQAGLRAFIQDRQEAELHEAGARFGQQVKNFIMGLFGR